jgi:hypothetical protein
VSARKCPILLRKGGFSGAIYAARRYTVDASGLMTMHDKDDVTQDFYRLAAELWPQLVADGSLTPLPVAEQEPQK